MNEVKDSIGSPWRFVNKNHERVMIKCENAEMRMVAARDVSSSQVEKMFMIVAAALGIIFLTVILTFGVRDVIQLVVNAITEIGKWI